MFHFSTSDYFLELFGLGTVLALSCYTIGHSPLLLFIIIILFLMLMVVIFNSCLIDKVILRFKPSFENGNSKILKYFLKNIATTIDLYFIRVTNIGKLDDSLGRLILIGQDRILEWRVSIEPVLIIHVLIFDSAFHMSQIGAFNFTLHKLVISFHM